MTGDNWNMVHITSQFSNVLGVCGSVDPDPVIPLFQPSRPSTQPLLLPRVTPGLALT